MEGNETIQQIKEIIQACRDIKHRMEPENHKIHVDDIASTLQKLVVRFEEREWGRKFEVIDCPDCRDGEVWYPGCGDQAATCRTCEGVGQIERRK